MVTTAQNGGSSKKPPLTTAGSGGIDLTRYDMSNVELVKYHDGVMLLITYRYWD